MTMPHPPRLILVTGIMASGKSTVAERLAERLPHSAHVRGDTFRTMIVNGRAEFALPPSDEAWRQVLLRYRIAASVIEHYLGAGFTVVYQDVILGPALAAVARTLVHHALHVVVLHTDPDVAAQRDAQRDKDAYAHETPTTTNTSCAMRPPASACGSTRRRRRPTRRSRRSLAGWTGRRWLPGTSPPT